MRSDGGKGGGVKSDNGRGKGWWEGKGCEE